VAKYSEPNGKKVQDDAVTPNVVVASPEDDGEPMPQSNGDNQLNQALALLKAKNG
jgi:carboxyl-terminal processing protease